MDTPQPGYRLYTVGQITLAAFLGTPFPGFWLASRNFKELGQQKEARRSLMWGIGLTLGGFVLAYFLPERFPALIISLPFIMITRSMAQLWFGQKLAAHVAAGGRIGSWWTCVFISIISLVLFLALIFGLILLS